MPGREQAATAQRHRRASRRTQRLQGLPLQPLFLVSAVFHYLGPSFAVLLFARVDVLGVAWLRIATAAAVFAVWRRPWRLALRLDRRGRWLLVELGVVLAAMNSVFYLAVDRLPLSTVGSIEFLGTVVLAALGARTRRNAAALALTTVGVATITEVRIGGQALGFAFAFANCALFVLYVILGHRIANARPEGGRPGHGLATSVDRLGASMLVAAVAVTPVGFVGAFPAFFHPGLLLAGIGVGVCSSVIPYVIDQLAMARLPRATFALMLALLPMFATIIGAVVLGQFPTAHDLIGIALVIGGVALHEIPAEAGTSAVTGEHYALMERDLSRLPPHLPVPTDDGAAAHLIGNPLPDHPLHATDGRRVRLERAGNPWIVVYAYPRTGRPGEPPLVPDWDLIPGARGCTPESCGFRDHHSELAALGADVYGLSTQSTKYQQEVVERLKLPFPLLSDQDLRLAQALRLPTFDVGGNVLLKRLTFVARAGVIEQAWYPVFPPDTHAEEVVEWLRAKGR